MNNSFIKAIWEKNEKRHKLPSRCRNIIISDFEEIKLKIREKNQSYLEELIENIYKQDVLDDKGILIIEHKHQLNIQSEFKEIKSISKRKYGDSAISIYKKGI